MSESTEDRRGAIAYHISFPQWIFERDPGKWCPEVRVGSLMTASTEVCRVSFGALWAELKKMKKNGAYATFEGALGRARQWATKSNSPKPSRNRSARTLGRALAPRFVGPARNPCGKAHARTAISTRAIAQYHTGATTGPRMEPFQASPLKWSLLCLPTPGFVLPARYFHREERACMLKFGARLGAGRTCSMNRPGSSAAICGNG